MEAVDAASEAAAEAAGTTRALPRRSSVRAAAHSCTRAEIFQQSGGVPGGCGAFSDASHDSQSAETSCTRARARQCASSPSRRCGWGLALLG